MSRLACTAALFFLAISSLNAGAGGVDAHQVLQVELGLSSNDAAVYWDGLSYNIASTVAEGNRLALDGLGAFEPTYTNDARGEVVRSMKFAFDLGPAIEQPCVTTIFDEEFLKRLANFEWLAATRGTVERRLQGEEWDKLLNIFVFFVLRNIDGHARQPLGMDLGYFYPTVDVDLSTDRDDDQRRLVVNFYADDDSRKKFRWQYDTSIAQLQIMIFKLEREAADLNRYARLTGIREYTDAELIVAGVARAFTTELNDLNNSRAQDHNSSRSNKTASIISGGVDELGDAQDVIKKAAAQDHNSSRSNKTASAISNVEDEGAWTSETLSAPAQDHNSSRSNKTASKSADFYNDLLNRYDGAYTTRAQDHNSSRSNKTASVSVDFEPGPGLEEVFRKATF